MAHKWRTRTELSLKGDKWDTGVDGYTTTVFVQYNKTEFSVRQLWWAKVQQPSDKKPRKTIPTDVHVKYQLI